MKRQISLVFLIGVFVSSIYCQDAVNKVFDNNWDVKKIDLNIAYQNKGLTEKDLSSMGLKGGYLYTFDAELNKIPVKISYTYKDESLVIKAIAGGGQDPQISAKLLKDLKDLTIKKYGNTIEEKTINGMKTISWKSTKVIVVIMQMGNVVNLQIMNKNRLNGIK